MIPCHRKSLNHCLWA
uniref:Uncharacterized protein n=1 Tax=Rhizophora mucronata TaxID=61149 RepID=A0A2P2PWF2_RHIMU